MLKLGKYLVVSKIVYNFAHEIKNKEKILIDMARLIERVRVERNWNVREWEYDLIEGVLIDMVNGEEVSMDFDRFTDFKVDLRKQGWRFSF